MLALFTERHHPTVDGAARSLWASRAGTRRWPAASLLSSPPQPPKTRPSEPVQCWYKKHNNLQLAFTRDEDYKTFNCTYNEANTCGQLNMRWLSSLWVRDFMMSNKESCSQHDEYVGVFTVRVDVAAINNSVWIHLLTLSFVQIIVLFVVIIQCFVSQTFYSISCSVLIE